MRVCYCFIQPYAKKTSAKISAQLVIVLSLFF